MARGSIASDTNVCFKQLCSPVAAINGPWNCVLYRDIRLLKAHLCSHRFSSNCVGYVAPKRSSGCGFVLLTYVIPMHKAPPVHCVHLVKIFFVVLKFVVIWLQTCSDVTYFSAHGSFIDNSAWQKGRGLQNCERLLAMGCRYPKQARVKVHLAPSLLDIVQCMWPITKFGGGKFRIL